MTDFFEALHELPFLRYALGAGLLSSVAFGILGSYVVVRRTTYLVDAVAHCVLGGIGAALFLHWNVGLMWLSPMAGGIAVALVAALGMGAVSLYAREREDTVISVVWVLGAAVGLLLLEQVRTPPGEIRVEPLSYLVGDILVMSAGDLRLVAWLDAGIVALVLLLHRKFVATSFDGEFAEVRGLWAKGYYLLLLCLTAVAIVLLVRMVGVLLVVALMTLPAATAGYFARRIWQMMALAVLLCAGCVVAGLYLSYTWDVRTGPTIVLIAGVVYAAVAGLSRLRRPAG